jgi:NAD-dependent deacetylase
MRNWGQKMTGSSLKMNPPGVTSEVLASVAALLRQAGRIVILTGAGISAESGIPTFRDSLTGLWQRFDAEDLATPEAFQRDKALVWGWYEWRRMKVMRAQPNPGHWALAELARLIPSSTIITQNVDDLHERAGSQEVIHLHGSLLAPRCFACARAYPVADGIPDEPEGGRHLQPPSCPHCGGYIRPGIVWFGERLPEAAWHQAEVAVHACDLLLVIGTSGLVYPAAHLPEVARQRGKPVILIGPNPTEIDHVARHILRGNAGEVLPKLINSILNRDLN